MDGSTSVTADPDAWAKRLGISREAVELYQHAEVIDLHLDTFIWTRMWGYDPTKRHGRGLFGARYYGQADLPRLREAGVAGALWSITTSPMRTPSGRARAFVRNQRRLVQLFERAAPDLALVRSYREYVAARRAGKHAAFIVIQGGNALDEGGHALDLIDGDAVVAVTLVHLSNSSLGATSSPARLGRDRGLTSAGLAYVEALNARRILVDLAHVSPQGFADALTVLDPAQPFVVTHTGVRGAHDCWRNLDDGQLRAVADSGGTVGVIFHGGYLGGSYLFGGSASLIVDHIEHIIRCVGEDHASLGSDWDGAIITPRDMPTCLELPKLVQIMLDRGFGPERIQKVLGGNFLRVLRAVRP